MRPTRDEVLMDIARAWEPRSTCDRKHVGAIIARDGRTLASGYNGAPAGMPHCNHPPMTVKQQLELPLSEFFRPNKGCKVAVHAEANAIAFAARVGVSTQDAELFTTMMPCYACAQLIINAGIIRVVFGRDYRDRSGYDLLVKAGIRVENL